MARKELFTDVFETDTFNEWRLKTNSIKINLQDIYDELDSLDSRVVLLTGNQTIDGVKSFIQKSRWTKEYTQNEVTPMLELKVTNSTFPHGQNVGHKGTGPSIDFYNPDTTTSGNTWLTSRIASITESGSDILPDASLVFYTGKNVKDIVEKMRITSSGNVGIGTSSPSTQLSVQTATNNSIISIRSKDDKYAALTFGDSKSYYSGQIQYHNIGNSMRFFTGEQSSNSSAERVRITSNGKVGIGTSSPSEKLDVDGNLKTTGSIESAGLLGGVALTRDDDRANVTFNHYGGKAGVNGSSGRISCSVNDAQPFMHFHLGANAVKNSSQELPSILSLSTTNVRLLKDTRVSGTLDVSEKVAIQTKDKTGFYPDWDLCVGNKSTEAGHIAMHANGGALSLRPLKNTTHAWMLNAYDSNAGSMGVVSRKWNATENKYNDTTVLDFYSNNSVNVRSKLAVGGFVTGSSAKFTVRGESDNSISSQFRGTIQVNQFNGVSRAHAFLSTNQGSAMVGGNLRFNGTEYEKGTDLRGSAAIEFIEGSNSTGEIKFLRANDTNNGAYTVTESGRFDENGRFGIGVTNPTQALDVAGNIKGSGLMYLTNDGYPQLVLSDANQQTRRFGIWKENTNDQLAIGPQTTSGSGTPAIRIYRNATVDILKGGKVNTVLSDDKALVNKKWVEDAISTGGLVNIGGSDVFQATGNISYTKGDKNQIKSPLGNYIPDVGAGNNSHGKNFAGILTSTHGSDGGGLFLDVTDNNNDEHALSIYNTAQAVNKEVFHIRSATGDTYSAGDIHARGGIASETKLAIGDKDEYWTVEKNNTDLRIVYRKGGTTKTALTLNALGQQSIEREPTGPKHAATKQYVDKTFASVNNLNTTTFPKYVVATDSNVNGEYAANTEFSFDIKALSGLNAADASRVYAVDATIHNFGSDAHDYNTSYRYPDNEFKEIQGSKGYNSDDDCGGSAQVLLPVSGSTVVFKSNTSGTTRARSQRKVVINGFWYYSVVADAELPTPALDSFNIDILAVAGTASNFAGQMANSLALSLTGTRHNILQDVLPSPTTETEWENDFNPILQSEQYGVFAVSPWHQFKPQSVSGDLLAGGPPESTLQIIRDFIIRGGTMMLYSENSNYVPRYYGGWKFERIIEDLGGIKSNIAQGVIGATGVHTNWISNYSSRTGEVIPSSEAIALGMVDGSQARPGTAAPALIRNIASNGIPLLTRSSDGTAYSCFHIWDGSLGHLNAGVKGKIVFLGDNTTYNNSRITNLLMDPLLTYIDKTNG